MWLNADKQQQIRHQTSINSHIQATNDISIFKAFLGYTLLTTKMKVISRNVQNNTSVYYIRIFKAIQTMYVMSATHVSEYSSLQDSGYEVTHNVTVDLNKILIVFKWQQI